MVRYKGRLGDIWKEILTYGGEGDGVEEQDFLNCVVLQQNFIVGFPYPVPARSEVNFLGKGRGQEPFPISFPIDGRKVLR